MGLYYKKQKIAGINFLPRLTLAEYNNLQTKPKYWIRTDTPSGYLKLNATDVSYDNNTNVKEKIDGNALKYTDITGTTDANGYINVSTDVATVDNFISAFVLEPRRQVCTWWLNEVEETQVRLRITSRGDNTTALASTSVKVRIWYI